METAKLVAMMQWDDRVKIVKVIPPDRYKIEMWPVDGNGVAFGLKAIVDAECLTKLKSK